MRRASFTVSSIALAATSRPPVSHLHVLAGHPVRDIVDLARAVSGPLIDSSFAVAAISIARKRKRSLPLMTSEPQMVCIRNTYWEFSSPVRPACNSGCGGEWAHLSSGKARWLLEVSGEARAHYGERNAKCSGCGAQTKQSNRCHLKPSRQPRGIPIIAPEPCSAVNPSRAGAETLSSNAWIRPPARHEWLSCVGHVSEVPSHPFEGGG